MKVLVIPDVHLKPDMFKKASRIMYRNVADRAVCLMDLADDWNQWNNLELYKETYDAAIKFAKDFPDSLWCYGNHDLSYDWRRTESGFSYLAVQTVQQKLTELKRSLPENESMMYVQRIDNVLFSHAGVVDYFVKENVPDSIYDNIDETIDAINHLGANEMWTDLSPIWHRSQYSYMPLYKEEQLLQVVGHTPVDRIAREGNVISCDVFSTYENGEPIGLQRFLVVDTETWEFSEVV